MTLPYQLVIGAGRPWCEGGSVALLAPLLRAVTLRVAVRSQQQAGGRVGALAWIGGRNHPQVRLEGLSHSTAPL